MPESASRLVSLHDVDARPIRKGRLGKPVEFGYRAQIVDDADGVILVHIEVGDPADAPELVPVIERITTRTGQIPRAVTADRGTARRWSNTTCICSASAMWRSHVSSQPSAARREFEHRRAFREKLKWRMGSEGRINHIKRSYGWNRTELTGIHGARRVADTACSPTTSSRSAPSQHDTNTPSLPPHLTRHLRPHHPRRSRVLQVEVASTAGA